MRRHYEKPPTTFSEGLKSEGVSHVFMVPGALIDPFLSAFDRVDGMTPIVAAHEGGAAYMADGFGRGSGHFGVCFCIGGPGITNTVTAMATALTDEFPLLLMSGWFPRIGRDGAGSRTPVLRHSTTSKSCELSPPINLL
jgi:thiamine pyrophosphate-dependent acetolactate synthase large subunit-like protein